MHTLIVVKSAKAFLSCLRPTHRRWHEDVVRNPDWQTPEVWGFRGQKDSTWSLVPKAFRKGLTVGFKPSSTPPVTPADHRDEERRAIVDFLFFADRVGLRIPGDGQHFRVPSLPGHPIRPGINHWPWENTLDTLAIAQHHGVPTRLLDFSHSATTAAFFACYDAWNEMGRPSLSNRKKTPPKYVSVWALHLPLIHKRVALATQKFLDPRLILVTAPRAENSFLHHQDGFFLLDLQADDKGYPALEEAIDDVQQEMVAHYGANPLARTFSKPQLLRIDLPWNEVPRCLELLWYEFVNVARMQPTTDNVVQALRDYQDLFRT